MDDSTDISILDVKIIKDQADLVEAAKTGLVVKERKIQAEEWDPQHALLAHAAGSGSDALARFYREQNELDAAIWKHERRYKEKGKDGVIDYKEAVALAERIRDLYLSEGFDGRPDHIAFRAGRCLTLKEGRATGKVYTAIASLEVVNIPEWRGAWWPVNLAIPAELRVAGPDAPPLGVQTPDWLSRRCEDVARELARCGSPPGSPASRMFDGGGFALIYESGKLSEQPEPDSIPVVLAPHEDTIKDYIQCAASSPDHRADYWDALKKAEAMLRRSQQPFGEALSDWLDGQTKRRDGRKFAQSAANALRNFAIKKVIDVLERCGIPPTRNRNKKWLARAHGWEGEIDPDYKPLSGCIIAAKVFGIKNPVTVENVWRPPVRK